MKTLVKLHHFPSNYGHNPNDDCHRVQCLGIHQTKSIQTSHRHDHNAKSIENRNQTNYTGLHQYAYPHKLQ